MYKFDFWVKSHSLVFYGVSLDFCIVTLWKSQLHKIDEGDHFDMVKKVRVCFSYTSSYRMDGLGCKTSMGQEDFQGREAIVFLE